MEKTYRLVGAGTGTRYPCITGALRGLAKHNYKPIELLGTSGSAVVLTKFAGLNGDVARLENVTRTLLPKTLLDLNLLPFGGTKGLYTGEKMLKAFRANLPATFERCPIPVHVVAHNWTKRSVQIFNKGDLPLAVRASMSLPIFDMVRINGDLFEDGGIDANAYFDFLDWGGVAQPDTITIGLKVRTVGYHEPRRDPMWKWDRFLATTEDLIEANDREHIRSAIMAKVKVVFIDTKYSSVNFDITAKDVDAMMAEGEAAIEAAIAKGDLLA